MTPGHDALPANAVGYDPSDPVQTNPDPAESLSGVPTTPENVANYAVLESLTPDTGLEAGGEEIVIAGTNLAEATAVAFGAEPATSFEVTEDSDEEITAVAPAGTEGEVEVTVTTPLGTSNGLTYTYTAE
jgi:hypothetical protein